MYGMRLSAGRMDGCPTFGKIKAASQTPGSVL
jgi:hypothetical protein